MKDKSATDYTHQGRKFIPGPTFSYYLFSREERRRTGVDIRKLQSAVEDDKRRFDNGDNA